MASALPLKKRASARLAGSSANRLPQSRGDAKGGNVSFLALVRPSATPARRKDNRRMRTTAVLFALTALSTIPTAADPALDALVAAYPDHLARYEGNDLIWKDGSRMPIADGRTDKTFQELLDRPDIKDQFAFRYPLGADVKPPGRNEDPGRIRFEPFFLKMYGDCRKGEVAKRLKPVAW